MESAQARVQNAVTSVTEDLEKNVIRNIELEMYKCQVSCCENKFSSVDEKTHCLDRCTKRMQGIQNYLQSELQSFESRLRRCAMDCQDRVNDKVTGDIGTSEKTRLTAEMEKCAINCVDTHIDLLKPMFKRISTNIAKDNL